MYQPDFCFNIKSYILAVKLNKTSTSKPFFFFKLGLEECFNFNHSIYSDSHLFVKPILRKVLLNKL